MCRTMALECVSANLFRDLLILVKLVRHDNEVGAGLLGLRNEHAGTDAKLASLIVSRRNFPSALGTVGVADCKRLALEGGLC